MLPLLVGLLALASATDSIATPIPTASLPDTRALFVPGDWGLGFRVFGTGASIRIDRALAPRVALGLRASWDAEYQSTTTSSSERIQRPPYYAIRDTTETTSSEFERTYSTLALALPLQWIVARRGDLRLEAEFGPTWSIRFVQDQTEGERFQRSETTTQSLGATASLGIAWEFVPGLFLASGFGADARRAFATTKKRSQTSWQSSSGESEGEGWYTETWFGGIGLDAWF